MYSASTNAPALGTGIYTIPDAAQILGLPYEKVRRWIRNYWDQSFSATYKERYSWTDGKSIAVSFHTLIELYTFYQLAKSGVSNQKVVEAHVILGKQFDTPFPFAKSNVLEHLRSDGRYVYFHDFNIIRLDEAFQLCFDFIQAFFKKIDFDGGLLAARLWPLGKDRSIVVDPSHQFGRATIAGTNISAETLYELHEGGDPTNVIAKLYGLSENQVLDSIEFFASAA